MPDILYLFCKLVLHMRRSFVLQKNLHGSYCMRRKYTLRFSSCFL